MAKAKIEKLEKSSRRVTVKGKEYSIGKKVWNRENLEVKLEAGDEIEYNLKGANFEFIRVISGEERKADRRYRGSGGDQNKRMEVFSYPYNFVGLSSKVGRGIYERGEYSGTIRCSLENLSPLFISGEKVDDGSGHMREYFLHDGRDYIIPGSQLPFPE